MLSLVSHTLSIIKYVVLKKIFFLSLFWPSHLDLDLDLDSNLFGLGLDSDSNLFGLGLDSDSNLFGLGLVLDSTKVDLTTALLITHGPERNVLGRKPHFLTNDVDGRLRPVAISLSLGARPHPEESLSGSRPGTVTPLDEGVSRGDRDFGFHTREKRWLVT